jgi:hypothetical protein
VWEVNESGSTLCLLACFGISDIRPLDSDIIVVVIFLICELVDNNYVFCDGMNLLCIRDSLSHSGTS